VILDRELSFITSPVILNGKFTEVIKIQVNALEQAKALGDDTPVHMFTKGASVGAFDAGLEFFDGYEEEPSPARNLERYLCGFELDWEDNVGILDD